MLTLDGRLDNHQQLSSLLDIADASATDSDIMLAAFRRWGRQCFARFIGEWALAIWCEAERLLYLARDHAGTRSLYVEQSEGRVRWSTFLDTLLSDRQTRALDERYLAAYLRGEPMGDRTPYAGISAVTPAHVLVFDRGGMTRISHWSPLTREPIRHRTDEAYEEQFFALLQQSVDRRSGVGAPILAQLSGGMDSSTIVCMSDFTRAKNGNASKPLLDTISFYDDSEPGWNERPFFTAVESLRGKTGVHMDVSEARPTFQALGQSTTKPLLPGLDSGVQKQSDVLERLIAGRGYRVILSGLGGDELLGGVPSPLPELSDHLIAGAMASLVRRGVNWGLASRKPLGRLLWDTLIFSSRAYLGDPRPKKEAPPWVLMDPKSAPVHHGGMVSRLAFSPSAITTASTWWTLLETLPNPQLAVGERREYRFPYLDRDLVDFLLRVPNDQLVRPGRRRSLMRRAIKNIVPESVLERRRKGFIARSPAHTLNESSVRIRELLSNSILAEHGFIDRDRFDRCLQQAITGTNNAWNFPLLRTCSLELWLKADPPIFFRR